MRISDWSSDVCSSDLEALQALEVPSQTIGHRQRHHSQQARHLQIALVLKLPTRCLIDRLEVAFIAVALAVWRNAHHAVQNAQEFLPLPQLVLDIFPLARPLADQLGSGSGRERVSQYG